MNSSERGSKLSYLTLAIAKNAPVGVVIAAWSSRLSRMYRWDVENDTFTPGQFLKGRANVVAISPDGKHVVYFAEIHHKNLMSHVGVSHVPYFTAHAYFPYHHLYRYSAEFRAQGNVELHLGVQLSDTNFGASVGRIDPGCPFVLKIVPPMEPSVINLMPEPFETSHAKDQGRNRTVFANGFDLAQISPGDKEGRVIASFSREQFQEIVAPDWAQQW